MAIFRTVLVVLTSAATAAKLRLRSLPFDCYGGKGAAYQGLKDISTSGRECMNWVKQGKEKGEGIGNHNYCRNPGGKKDKPWCYTVDPAVEWEFCEVPKCAKEAETPKPFVAPDGAKSKGSKPCEYKPPDVPGYKEHEAGRACMDNKGDKCAKEAE